MSPSSIKSVVIKPHHIAGVALFALVGAFFYIYSQHFSSEALNGKKWQDEKWRDTDVRDAPFIHVMMGADLWSIFVDRLGENHDGKFPLFTGAPLHSRNLVARPCQPAPHQIMVMMPAEKFLVDEYYKRQSGKNPDLVLSPGPPIRHTRLVLLMSPTTYARLSSALAKPDFLVDWLAACSATSHQTQPVLFCMADPNTCSSSWIGLADMAAEKMGGAQNLTAGTAQIGLDEVIRNLKSAITIEGSSDRIEMYKYLLAGCPEGRILLTYDHLSKLIKADPTHKFVVVKPRVKFDPTITSLIVFRQSDHFILSDYLPTLMKEWTDLGLKDVDSTDDAAEKTSVEISPLSAVPSYQEMRTFLEKWNSD
jgi:hypothetical protein